MADAHRDPVPQDVVRSPRPGGLLAAAGAVPLGVAVLLAAGDLPGLARGVLGVAVAVLGAALLRQRETAAGARLGRGMPSALGTTALVLGAALTAGAVASAVDGRDGGLGAAGALLFWLALAATAVALLGAPDLGRGASRTAEVLLGAALAGALAALVGDGLLGLGVTARTAVLLLVAAAATAAAAVRSPAGGPRVAAIASVVLLAFVGGEATGLVGDVAGSTLQAVWVPASPSDALVAARTAVVLLLAGALLVLALTRRDVVAGVLAAGVLLGPVAAGSAGSPAAVLAVPVLAALLAAAAVRSAPLRARMAGLTGLGAPAGPGAAGPGAARVATAALAVALVVVAVALHAAFPDGDAAAVLVVLLVAAAAAVGLVLPSGPGVAALAAALGGIAVLQPVHGLFAALDPGWVSGGRSAAVLAALVQAAVAAGLVWRRRAAPLLALATVVLARQASTVALAAMGPDGSDDVVPQVLATLGVPTAGLVVAALLALLGPPARLLGRQAVAAALAFVAASTAPGVAAGLGLLVIGDQPPATSVIQDDAARLVAVLVGLAFVLGLALLASTAARRPSVAVSLAVLFGTTQAALYAGAVGAAVGDGARPTPATTPDAVLGFEAVGSGAMGAGAAWPLLFGLLGAALLAAAWWLESRRPAPAGVALR